MNRRLTTLACCLVATALSAQTPIKNDFNGDAKSDVLWQKTTTSAVVEQQMFNSSIIAQGAVHTPASVNYVVVATGDVNKDGNADLFWQNKLTGQVYLMTMNGLTAAVPATLVATEKNPDWQIVLAADFDRDGASDLLWRNVATGEIYMMFLNTDGTVKATSKKVYTEANTAWRPVAAGPFSKSGGNDIIWHNSTTGQVYLMIVGADGTPASSSAVIYSEPDTNWKLVGAGDFNRDGNMDLVWWNPTTSQVYLHLLDAAYAKITVDAGKGASGIVFTADVTQPWSPVAIGDYNGDGYADILWRNTTTGQIFMQFMDSAHPGQVNATDSAIVYTESDLTWRPVAGLTSVTIDAPVVSTPLATTKWKLAPPTDAAKGFVPTVYVTNGDSITFGAAVKGPVASSAVTWSSWKLDGSAPLATGISLNTSTGVVSGSVSQDFLLKAVSNVDATKVSSRRVSVVDAPGVTSLVATPSIVNSGATSTLAFTFPAGQTGVLTCDADPTLNQAFAASGSVVVTPAATGTYTLAVTNAAGKSSSSNAVVTVNLINAALDCTVTINAPTGHGTSLTANSIYTASVPAFAAGVTGTYAWTITGGTISGASNGSTVTFVTNGSGSVVLTMQKTVGTGTNTGSSASQTIVAAPVAPTAVTVANDAAAPQTTYLTASRVNQTAAVTANAGMTYLWTVTNATITSAGGAAGVTAAGTNTITFTPAASGTVSLSVVEINAAMTQSAPKAVTRTIVAAPDATVTVPTAYVTPGIASNGVASVVSAANTTYLWSITPASGSAVATNGSPVGTLPALTYTQTGGTAGNTVSLSCAVTNGAGLTVNTPTPKTQQICAVPGSLAAATITPAAANVTVGFTSTATLSAGYTAAGGHTYDDFTYTWTVTNATITGSATGRTITYTPTGTGDVTFAVKEVNAAGYSGVVSPTVTVTAVAAPVISAFTAAAATISAGDSSILNYSFSGGTGSIVDSAGAAPLLAIPASQLTSTYTGLAANAVATKHTLTLRVTNAASDFVQQTVTVDVAAVPVIASFVLRAADATAYAGPYDFGSAVQLVPTYTASSASTFEGQTVVINPGNAAVNPATTVPVLVTPAQGTTNYVLSITNRAGKVVTSVTSPAAAVINTVAVGALSSAGTATQSTSTYTIAGGTVTGAVNTSVTYEIVSGGTFSGTVSIGTGNKLVLGAGTGTVLLRARSVADTSVVGATLTVTVS